MVKKKLPKSVQKRVAQNGHNESMELTYNIKSLDKLLKDSGSQNPNFNYLAVEKCKMALIDNLGEIMGYMIEHTNKNRKVLVNQFLKLILI